MKNLFNTLFFSTLMILGSCNNDDAQPTIGGTATGSGDNEWLIPQGEVRDGGPGKDGIPAIEFPIFSTIEEIDFLDPDDLVIMIESEDGVKAYPHAILNWHEIVNDELSNTKGLSLTYCPLTGTAIAWNNNIGGTKTTFGVSGLLYNSNLMPYDRATDSFWSQMEHKCVNGELVDTEIETYHVVETAYNTLRELYPEALVLNKRTGFNRNYDSYPYGDYLTNNDNIIFPVSNTDSRVPNKERVLGVVVKGAVMTYRFQDFEAEEINIVQQKFQETDLVIIGSKSKNILTAFENRLADGTNLTFEPVLGALPIVMQDNEGNKWDVFGTAIDGPRKGESLTEVLNYLGFWFSWAAFNQNLEIYEG